MSYNVKLTPQFDCELLDISDYISNNNPDNPKIFVWRVLQDINKYLSVMPSMYRIYENDIRFFPFDSYLIFYKVISSKNEVVILHIIHGAREISKLDIFK